MTRYTLHAQGPDNRSTYAECWGADRTSHGREIATATRLAHLIRHADGMGHENWIIRDAHRRESISPREFWSRACVIAALAAAERRAS